MKIMKTLLTPVLGALLGFGTLQAQSDMDKTMANMSSAKGLGVTVGASIGPHLNMFDLSGKHLELADSDNLLPTAVQKIATTNSATVEPFSGTTGLNLGLFGEYNPDFAPFLMGRVGFNYDMLLTGKSRKITMTSTAGTFNSETKLSGSLIQIPILVGPTIRQGKHSVYAAVGVNYTMASLTYEMTGTNSGFNEAGVTGTGPKDDTNNLFAAAQNTATEPTVSSTGKLELKGKGYGYQFLLGWGYEIMSNISIAFEWSYVNAYVMMSGDIAEDPTATNNNKVAEKVGELATWELGSKTNGARGSYTSSAGVTSYHYELPVWVGGHTFQVAAKYSL